LSILQPQLNLKWNMKDSSERSNSCYKRVGDLSSVATS